MGEILRNLSKDKKKNLKDLPDGKSKYLTPVSDKDKDIIKGDESESGSNSYAKSNQDTIKKLKGVKLTPISDRDIEIVTDTKIIKKKD